MQPDATTPMITQYLEIKKNYPDCLLFYRMGDFYELFFDDAHVGNRVLNITLTGKANGKNGRIPMAGVPYHAVDSYLSKLVKAGYKVAICEQLSPPNKKGLVKRDVVRVVTPGTVLDEKALEKKSNNYIISLMQQGKIIALTVADISTGYFATNQYETENPEQSIKDELARIRPAECILSEKDYNDPEMLKLLQSERGINIFPFAAWDVFADDASSVLHKHFQVKTLAGFGLREKKQAVQTAAALLGYLQETQKQTVTHIKKIETIASEDMLLLDRSTILNLELFSTIREHDSRGTLLSVLDETVTPMGGRLLKQWLRKPLSSQEEITKRHETVEYFLKNAGQRTSLRELLEQVSDIERLISRLSVGLGNARDVINLKNSLTIVLDIKKSLAATGITLIQDANKQISPKLTEICTYIKKNILPEPPITLREGRMMQSGINKELDRLRKIVGGSRELVLELEQKEREKTGIGSLKVRFNQVFGFYIEVSKSNLHLVPQNYIRKQTLVNGERFITPELKEQEEIILTSEERINELEYQLFQEVLSHVLAQVDIMQIAAQQIALLDCLSNFAYLAEKNKYIRPQLIATGEICITNGRHPVVEQLLHETPFVPNDVDLLNSHQQLLLITGPNMAGKSVFIRQVALIVLMNQLGSFVPADQAQLSIVDRIFVRSGASDVITSGLSTFMVEMVETAYILHHATEKSLIVMDEIGRGTSTYDGISIAWAVAEHLVTCSKPPKTLFATHYHELQQLEELFSGKIKNYHMSVANRGEGQPVFLHTIQEGGASHSFGVAVAKLAGIPDAVITRANELLAELEERAGKECVSEGDLLSKDSESTLIHRSIEEELEEINIHQLTPLEALNILAELKDKVKFVTLKKKEFIES